MTDDTQQRQQMQEALDATLKPDAYRELMAEMDADAKQQYRKLQTTDALLKEARPAPVPLPSRMAANIMARIAQPESLPVPQPYKSGAALAVGLAVGAVIGFGALVAVSVGVLATVGTASTLSGAALGIVGSAVALFAALDGLVSWAGRLLAGYPLIFGALALIPLAWAGLHLLGRRVSLAEGERTKETPNV